MQVDLLSLNVDLQEPGFVQRAVQQRQEALATNREESIELYRPDAEYRGDTRSVPESTEWNGMDAAASTRLKCFSRPL